MSGGWGGGGGGWTVLVAASLVRGLSPLALMSMIKVSSESLALKDNFKMHKLFMRDPYL